MRHHNPLLLGAFDRHKAHLRPTQASANAAVSAASFFPRDREVFVALRHDPGHVQVFDKALEEIADGRAQDHFLAMAVEP